MNNKGQTLILFVLILPIIVVLILLVVGFGNLYIEKNKIENTVKKIVYDELKKDDSAEYKRIRINNLLHQNIEDLENYDLIVNDEYIKITIVKTNKTFKKDIRISYKGYKINDEIKIKKEWNNGNTWSNGFYCNISKWWNR